MSIAPDQRLGRVGHVRRRPKTDGTGLEWGGTINLPGGGSVSDFCADDLSEAKRRGEMQAKDCGWAIDLLASWEKAAGESYVLYSFDDHDGRLGTA